MHHSTGASDAPSIATAQTLTLCLGATCGAVAGIVIRPCLCTNLQNIHNTTYPLQANHRQHAQNANCIHHPCTHRYLQHSYNIQLEFAATKTSNLGNAPTTRVDQYSFLRICLHVPPLIHSQHNAPTATQATSCTPPSCNEPQLYTGSRIPGEAQTPM